MHKWCKLVAVASAALLVTGAVLAQRGMRGAGVVALIGNPGVQKELKLTDEQIDKAKKVGQDLREKYQDDFAKLRDAKPEERREKFQELSKKVSAEAKKSLAGILKQEQIKRLRQIEFQQVGLSDPEAQNALKLTDEQKQKLKTIGEDTAKERREIMKNAQGDFKSAMEKMTKLRKDTQEKEVKVLTAEQTKAWKELQGEPFEVKFERRKKE